MFITFSKGGVGTLILFVSFFLSILGVDVDQTEIDNFARAVTEVIGFCLVVIGQIDRKDLLWGLFRKKDDV